MKGSHLPVARRATPGSGLVNTWEKPFLVKEQSQLKDIGGRHLLRLGARSQARVISISQMGFIRH